MFLNKVNEASISGIFSSICMMNKVVSTKLVFFSEWCVQSNLVLSSLLLFVSALLSFDILNRVV